MVIGVLRVLLAIEGAHDLKTKRRALRKVVDRLRARYNISVAEVGDNELWNRSLVGASVVSNSGPHANSMLDKAQDTIHEIAEVEVLDSELEIIHFGEEP
ncbi:MAG: DUF503 domain-containing protein [Candidatus Alcyoniella australis]|nr:DUF503 domain-containing protein [Candidatus Alcyoniella australis]